VIGGSSLCSEFGAPALRVEFEPELDPVLAVEDLQDRPRLEVLRTVRAIVVVVRQVARTDPARVVCVDSPIRPRPD
jgi:hypothetical protein